MGKVYRGSTFVSMDGKVGFEPTNLRVGPGVSPISHDRTRAWSLPFGLDCSPAFSVRSPP